MALITNEIPPKSCLPSLEHGVWLRGISTPLIPSARKICGRYQITVYSYFGSKKREVIVTFRISVYPVEPLFFLFSPQNFTTLVLLKSCCFHSSFFLGTTILFPLKIQKSHLPFGFSPPFGSVMVAMRAVSMLRRCCTVAGSVHAPAALRLSSLDAARKKVLWQCRSRKGWSERVGGFSFVARIFCFFKCVNCRMNFYSFFFSKKHEWKTKWMGLQVIFRGFLCWMGQVQLGTTDFRCLVYIHVRTRNWMEMNSLLVCFIESNLTTLDDHQVQLLSSLLETHSDVVLYPWLAGKSPLPSEMLKNEMMIMLLRYVNPQHPSLKMNVIP